MPGPHSGTRRQRSRLDQLPRIADDGAVVNNVRFIIQASKGFIRDHRMRRTLMFYNALVVLVMSFLGATFFWPWLREHTLFFLGYWAACAWFTILAACLAIYDLIRVRLEAREVERQIKKKFLHSQNSDSSHDSHAN